MTLSSVAVTGLPPAPELLAPAGNLECAQAAIENGADAIYFGLEVGFNARARATNFTLDGLPELMQTLHGRGMKGYVTLNTLAFTDELPQLEKHVRVLAESRVDAVLVQDLGVARLIRQLCPDLELHASTQMTLTCVGAIEMAEKLGVKRVVLARELSVAEISKIAAATTMPLEVFIHGALCVAYSGQCLTSESLGGRSANRGQCAQACRLPYDLICDGQPRDLGDQKYLLSPQDLAGYNIVPQLINAGVASLKIEGRLKTPEYVANTVSHYRRAIDQTVAGNPQRLSDQHQRELEMSFSRGFSPGWLEGNDHKRLVPGISSAKRGVLVGHIISRSRGRLLVKLDAPLAKGDGVVLEGNRAENREVGGRIYEIFQNGKQIDHPIQGKVELAFARGVIESADIFPGQQIWQTDDPQLSRRLRQTFSGGSPNSCLPIAMRAKIETGQPMQFEAIVLPKHITSADQVNNTNYWESIQSSPDIIHIKLSHDHLPEVARKHAIDQAALEQQFGRLGGTEFRLVAMQAEVSGQPMVPLSVLGQVRKQLINDLQNALRASQPRTIATSGLVDRMLQAARENIITPHQSDDASSTPVLRVLCRTLEQLEHLISIGVKEIIADFHDIREYRTAVQRCQDSGVKIHIATLRIHKPGEDGLIKAMEKYPADGWLVRHLAAAKHATEKSIPFDIDFSLNITNPLSAELWSQWGARRLTASYDLNRDQLLDLVRGAPSARWEVVIHQYMPMFHMEHCVFCSVLSPGTNKSNCGRPCDSHQVQLKDRVGTLHSLKADIGCRNTLYNGVPQSGAEAVGPLIAAGVRAFRIELLNESKQGEIERLVKLYDNLLTGQIDGRQVWQTLKADNRVGVTRGTMEQPRNPLAIL